MRKLVVVLVLLTGCTSTQETLDRLKFDEGEIGCLRVNGSIRGVTINYVKQKLDAQGNGPDC